MAISSSQLYVDGMRWEWDWVGRMVIIGQKKPEISRKSQNMSSEVIGSNWRSLEIIIGGHWRSLKVFGDHWRSLEAIGGHWRSLDWRSLEAIN